MCPEDLAAFAVGAAVPLWKAAVPLNTMEKMLTTVYETLLECKFRIDGDRNTKAEGSYAKLRKDAQKAFKARLLGFLEANQFIAKGARTGADWPAAALAGLFAGAALQAVREQRRVAAEKRAQEYYRVLQTNYVHLWAIYQDKADELLLAAVRLVVFSFVWYEYPRDLDRCRERLDALAPAVALSCLELLRPPDEWTSLQGQSKFFFVDKKK